MFTFLSYIGSIVIGALALAACVIGILAIIGNIIDSRKRPIEKPREERKEPKVNTQTIEISKLMLEIETTETERGKYISRKELIVFDTNGVDHYLNLLK